MYHIYRVRIACRQIVSTRPAPANPVPPSPILAFTDSSDAKQIGAVESLARSLSDQHHIITASLRLFFDILCMTLT